MNPERLTARVCAWTVCVLFVGCSGASRFGGSPRGDDVVLDRSVEIDIFSARGFLGGSEYERYHFKDSYLWRECGTLAGPEETPQTVGDIDGNDTLAPDPNLKIVERRVEELDAGQLMSVIDYAESFVDATERAQQRDPLPGSVFSLSQPGLFEMVVTVNGVPKRIVTSVDSVAESDTLRLKAANRLFARLRGIGPVMCDARTFYGIARIDS